MGTVVSASIVRRALCTGGILLACLGPATADEAPAARTYGNATNATNAAPRVTVERDQLFDRAGAPLDAQGRPSYELAGMSVRVGSRHGRADLGVGVGTLGFFDVQPLPPGADATASLRGTRPTVTLAWRWRVGDETALYADATSARRLATDAMPDLYATKVGMEWKPAKSSIGFEHRSLGIQLQSGYRMSLRAKSGGLGIYFRGQF